MMKINLWIFLFDIVVIFDIFYLMIYSSKLKKKK